MNYKPSHSRSKFGNKKVTIDKITFDSKMECEYYLYLKDQLKLERIKDLKLQVEFPFTIGGKKIFKYIADFVYYDVATSRIIIVDVKGYKTDVYRIKKKIIEAHYNIRITEITKKK